MHFPTTYRRIKELARKNGINISPYGTTCDFPNVCLLTMFGFANGQKDMCYCWADENLPQSKRHLLTSIECALEDRSNSTDDPKGTLVGKKLRADWMRRTGRTNNES